MAVRDFPPVPNDVEFEDIEFQNWLSKIENALNINDHLTATLATSDEVDVFNVSTNGRRKATITALLAAMGLRSGTGAPSNGTGSDGDYYFRFDAGASTHIYYKSGGSWAAIV